MYFEFAGRPRHGATWTPMTDVCERESEIVILVEMPGVDKSDVQLLWSEGVLIIAGHKRQHISERATARYLCVERSYGHFRREIEINIPVDRKAASADLKDGLLRITLPKLVSRGEPDNIPIR